MGHAAMVDHTAQSIITVTNYIYTFLFGIFLRFLLPLCVFFFAYNELGTGIPGVMVWEDPPGGRGNQLPPNPPPLGDSGNTVNSMSFVNDFHQSANAHTLVNEE